MEPNTTNDFPHNSNSQRLEDQTRAQLTQLQEPSDSFPTKFAQSPSFAECVTVRLSQELCSVQDFKWMTLSFIAALFRNINEELRTVERELTARVTAACAQAESELTQALDAPQEQSRVLDLLRTCSSPAEVHSLRLTNRELDFDELHLKEKLKAAFTFAVTIPHQPSYCQNSGGVQPQLSVNNARLLHYFRRGQTLPVPKPLRSGRRVIPPRLYWFTQGHLVAHSPVTNTTSQFELPKQEVGIAGSRWSELEGNLLITGGKATAPKNSTWIFDLYTEQFSLGPSMKTARFNHTTAVNANQLYVVGGVNKAKLKECERFDLSRLTWERIGSLNKPRELAAACMHQGKLFVAGDAAEVEVYSPLSNSFSLVTLQLPYRVRLFSVGSCICVLGKSQVSVFEFSQYTVFPVTQVCLPDLEVSGSALILEDGAYFVSKERVHKLDLDSGVCSEVYQLSEI